MHSRDRCSIAAGVWQHWAQLRGQPGYLFWHSMYPGTGYNLAVRLHSRSAAGEQPLLSRYVYHGQLKSVLSCTQKHFAVLVTGGVSAPCASATSCVVASTGRSAGTTGYCLRPGVLTTPQDCSASGDQCQLLLHVSNPLRPPHLPSVPLPPAVRPSICRFAQHVTSPPYFVACMSCRKCMPTRNILCHCQRHRHHKLHQLLSNSWRHRRLPMQSRTCSSERLLFHLW